MRRVVWSVLTGLGAFLIVVAIMSRFYAPGQAVKFPLNEYSVTTLVAANASWFSPKSVSELSPVTLQATETVRADLSASDALGSSATAVWQSYTAIEDTTDHQKVDIPASPNRLAFNRRTGVLVPWSGDSVDGTHVTVSGQGFVWPLGAKKQSYQVFDTTLLKPVTFRYKGATTISGIGVYEYAATVPSTQIGTQSLPGSLIGMSVPEITLPKFYSTTEDYYVDPVTGAPISVVMDLREVLKDSTGATRLVLIDGDFRSSAASVAAAVASDNKYRGEISLLTMIVPIVALVVGVVLLVIGLVLSRVRPEDEQYEDADEPVGTPA